MTLPDMHSLFPGSSPIDPPADPVSWKGNRRRCYFPGNDWPVPAIIFSHSHFVKKSTDVWTALRLAMSVKWLRRGSMKSSLGPDARE